MSNFVQMMIMILRINFYYSYPYFEALVVFYDFIFLKFHIFSWSEKYLLALICNIYKFTSEGNNIRIYEPFFNISKISSSNTVSNYIPRPNFLPFLFLLTQPLFSFSPTCSRQEHPCVPPFQRAHAPLIPGQEESAGCGEGGATQGRGGEVAGPATDPLLEGREGGP